MQYANARTSGDFVSRISADARETANGLDMMVNRALKYTAHILTSMFLLLKTDAMLTLAVGLLASVHFGVTKMFSGRLRRHSRRSAGLLGILSHTLFESVQGIRVIKTMAGERFMKKVLERAIRNWRESTMKMRMISLLDTPIRFFIDAALVGGALVMTFVAMSHGRLTIEAAALFFILTRQMIDPVSQLSRTVLNINGAIGGASRIQEVLNARATVKDGPDEAAALATSIRFEDVSFGYEKDTPVLTGISLEILRGQKVAVVGPSGGGKSTLADLLMRLYDPDQGRILYDGKDIRTFGQRGYRRQFGVVSQECLLFDGSIRENIVYGRPDDEAALQYALTVANAKNFIDAFTHGLETMVGERGVRLSGGQRQRIALARAMYSRPSILVLDEATSALDAESELAVQEGIDRAIKDCTALIIAHRFSTVANADTVVVLNNGRLEAMGRHQDLVAQSPTYRKLYDIQVQFQAPAAGQSWLYLNRSRL
jgi:subfamily B ATP-binding cassette protein MsbA